MAAAGVCGALWGCGIAPISDEISAFILNPSTTCAELATWLGLGDYGEVSSPADMGLIYQPFTVTSANGQDLQGWFVPAQDESGRLDAAAEGTVLLMHGTDGTRACTLPWLALAAYNGFGIVTFDYQGFDDSGGTADIATLYDDSSAVLDWVRAGDDPARRKVHLLGTSLGTGPALGLALRRPGEVVSLALDGTFDPGEYVRAVQLILDVPSAVIELAARRVFPWLMETYDRLDEVDTPALFLNGERDRNTPPRASRNVFDQLGSTHKTFWTFNRLKHLQALFYAEAEYVSLLVTFWRDPQSEPDPNAFAAGAEIVLPDLTASGLQSAPLP